MSQTPPPICQFKVCYATLRTTDSKGVNDIINNFIVAPRVVPRFGYISFEWVPVPGSKAYKNIIIPHPDGGNAYAERARRAKLQAFLI